LGGGAARRGAGMFRSPRPAGDVTITGLVDARDDVAIVGNEIIMTLGSHVFANAADSKAFLQAREQMLILGEITDEDAIIKGDVLVHLAAPSIFVDGVLKTEAADSRILVNAGETLRIAGLVQSAGDIDLNAGVNLTFTRDALEGNLDVDTFRDATLRVINQGVVQAGGTVTGQSGGQIQLEADANVGGDRQIIVPVITTVTENIERVVGFQEVAVGVIQVPVITFETTVVTEQVGTASVQVGSQFFQYDVQLVQTGYYNPNAPDGQKFREFFIEGVDYNNKDVDWTNAGTEQNPNDTADAVNFSYVDGQYKHDDYREWSQLESDQRQAVLNHLGYQPLYDFVYAASLDAIVNAQGGSAAADRTLDFSDVAIHVGELNAGSTVYAVEWAVVVSIGTGTSATSSTFTFSTDSTTTTSAAVANLAPQINAEAGFSATASGTTITISSGAGQAVIQAVANIADHVVLERTLNGQLSIDVVRPEWAGNDAQVFHVNVAGWRDKYIEMPVGAQEAILRVVSQGEAALLYNDPTRDGENDGGIFAVGDAVPAGAVRGELVGRVREEARVDYDQFKSNFTWSGSSSNGDDFDDVPGRWDVSYVGGTGERDFQIEGRSDVTIAYDPRWQWLFTQTDGQNDPFGRQTRNTDDVRIPDTFLAQLQNNTASLALAYTQSGGRHQVGWDPGGGRVEFYRHRDYSDLLINATGFDSWVGRSNNDEVSSVIVYGSTFKVEWYEHINFGGSVHGFQQGRGFYGGFPNDELSSYKVWGYEYENYVDYFYNWTQNWSNVYDDRQQLSYEVTTQADPLFDFRPVYETSEREVAVVNYQDVTVWETVPITVTETVTRTEQGERAIPLLGTDFEGESITGDNIVLRSRDATILAGLVTADSNLTIDADGTVEVSELTDDDGNAVMSLLVAGATLDIDAGGNVQVVDGAEISATTIDIDADGDLTLNGQIGSMSTADAPDAVNTETIDLDSGGEVEIGGSWSARDSITIDAGASAADFGGIETLTQGEGSLDIVITGTTGSVSLEAGRFGGNIDLSGASIDAPTSVTLTAEDGRVTHQGGAITSTTLTVTAGGAVTLDTEVSNLAVTTGGVGDVEVDNVGALTVTAITAFDGGVTVTNLGNLTVNSAVTQGVSQRNSITLEALSSSAAPVSLSAGTLSTVDRGDVTLRVQGNMTQQTGTLIAGDVLSIDSVGTRSLQTQVRTLALDIRDQGNVTINQGTRALTVDDSMISDGAFTLTAAGSVRLEELWIASNKDVNDISVTAAGNIVANNAQAGVYLERIQGAAAVQISAAGTVATSSRTLDFTGVEAVSGQAYAVTIGGTTFTYTAQAGDSLSDIVAALAGLVDANASYEARANDALLRIIDGAGLAAISVNSFLNGVEINAAGATDAAARTLNFAGIEAVEGGEYRIQIGNDFIRYEASATDTLNDIVTALAALVDAYDDYTASSSAGVLTISSGAGTKAITAFDLLGSAGEITLTSTGGLIRGAVDPTTRVPNR